ncbi:MAG: dethiobiotin synthase, partial [Endomicrobiaceae bacterium]|nr:dethiobiotin synthase [Endomicrobiaceae bacterium]
MSKSIFITGTATDVGKTFVTGLIVKKLHDSGINAGYYKAALSGAEKINGQLIPVDAKYVCDVAGIKEN